jgi:hypothetical protein
MSRRAHFTLTDRQYDFLVTESVRTGLPMAELVRRAIDSTYRPGLAPLVRGYEISAGLFKRPTTAMLGRRAGRRLFDG